MGDGRELLALSKQAYTLCAFGPLSISAKCAQISIPKENLLAFSNATYEDLVKCKLKKIESFAPYNAVILGWGSISHILDHKMQKLLLEKVRKLCPSDPILVSWLKEIYAGPKTKIFRSVLKHIGLKASDRDHYSFQKGFWHTFTCDEIFDLANSAGNFIVFYDDDEKSCLQGYPHAVLLPASLSIPLPTKQMVPI